MFTLKMLVTEAGDVEFDEEDEVEDEDEREGEVGTHFWRPDDDVSKNEESQIVAGWNAKPESFWERSVGLIWAESFIWNCLSKMKLF